MKIGSFLTASQKSKQLSHSNDNGENQVWYNASQGLTMERKRVEEFEETLMYRLWVNQSCFSLGFSLKILSRSSLTIVGKRGIYTGVGKECETSSFTKQGCLAA